jgi:hypothetical protein
MGPYGGEPFHERRARSLALPASYAGTWAQFVSDVIDADVGARYVSFAFWTKAFWGGDPEQVARKVQQACQFAACAMFPTINRHSLARIPLHYCPAAILVPAQKQGGVPHVHGLLRVPIAALNVGITVMSVETKGTRIRVSAPSAVERFAAFLRRFASGWPTSLHVDHDTSEAMPAVIDVTSNREARARVLGYLTQPGAEVRSWDLVQLVPRRQWSQLLAPVVDLAGHRTICLVAQSQVHEAVGAVESGPRESRQAQERDGRAEDVHSGGTVPREPTATADDRTGALDTDEAHERPSEGARAPLPPRLCAGCGGSFIPRRPVQRHCKPACRAAASRQREERCVVALLTGVVILATPILADDHASPGRHGLADVRTADLGTKGETAMRAQLLTGDRAELAAGPAASKTASEQPSPRANEDAAQVSTTPGNRATGGVRQVPATAGQTAAGLVGIRIDQLYGVENGCIVRRKTTHKSGIVIEPLANFEAHIREEVILDDGVESTRSFVIDGTLETGETLPTAHVSSAQFGSMRWVTHHWGAGAIIKAGAGTKDALREAIQALSLPVTRRQVFTHTGWRKTDAGWTYLTASGAVGQPGFEVDIGTELSRYALPQAPENPVDVMRASLRLLRLAPLRAMVPLWSAMFRAPLASSLPVDMSVWLVGQTGALKSTLTALLLSHFGDFGRTHLPGAWSATANHLEKRAFTLKDMPFPIDDYAPSPLETREMEMKAARVLRAQGNLAGRGRLHSNLTERRSYPPRGLIVATGEQHPSGHSVLARTLIVELRREDIDLDALSSAQATAGLLAQAMAAYIAWLAPQMDDLPAKLREIFNGARAMATQGTEHMRVPETVAHLYLGFDCALQFATEIGAITSGEAQQLRVEAAMALGDLATAQARVVEDERPTQRFLEVFSGLIDQDRVTLLPKWGTPDFGRDRREQRQFVGWSDDDYFYLPPDAIFGVVSKACRDSGDPFPVRRQTLAAALVREGYLEPAPDRPTRVVRLGGKPRRVWKLKREALDEAMTQNDEV